MRWRERSEADGTVRPPGAGRTRPDDRIEGAVGAVARGRTAALFTAFRVSVTHGVAFPGYKGPEPAGLGATWTRNGADKVRPGQV